MRTQEDNCLICESRKATVKNSHFTPIGLLSSNTGKRNYEETYAIGGDAPKIDTYYGRSNLKNTNPVPQKDPHAMDHIFCPDCERKLSVLESYCIPILNDEIRDVKKAESFPVTETNDDFYYKICVKKNPRRLTLFLYSVVWRQCLQQKLNTGTIIISDEFDKTIRRILSKCLPTDLASIDDCEAIDQLPPYSIITQKEFNDATCNAVNPFQERSNPALFFVNTLNVLVYHEGLEDKNLHIKGLNNDIFNPNIVNMGSTPLKIYFTSEGEWDLMKKATYSIAARQMFERLVIKVQNCKSIGYTGASALLNQLAHQIFKKNQEKIDFGKCCVMAADQICTQD